VTSSLHRRLRLLLISAAALVVWIVAPGAGWDRAAFATVASSFVNPPLFVSGQGTRADPWKLRAFSSESKLDRRNAPVIVALEDDPEGFFQSSPPAPIDLAVIFTNFHRLGAKKAATAAVLAWETPDPIGLAALEKSLSRFDSLVMAAPLSRGAVASAMPRAFRRASIPLSAVRGDTSSLPVVNRVPIPGLILGGQNSLAGFSVLEAEAADRFPPLLARWEDRLVFGFPLLTVLQRLDLPTDGVEVRLGEYLKLSPAGPTIPIDDYGRLAVPLKPIRGLAEISAEALIDGGDELFPKQAPDPVILRDDRRAAEPATRAFSRNLSGVIAAIASDEGLAEVREYPRLAPVWELEFLAVFVVVLTLLCRAADFTRRLGFLVVAGVCLSVQWAALGMASVWLPGMAVLAAILAALVATRVIREMAPKPVPEIKILLAPVTKVAKPKAPAKKAAAKKVHAKKVPAKKAVRTKKPPSKS
jgi:hypothetical protein